jgi:tetratricopeptide (TPR) repeat protein
MEKILIASALIASCPLRAADPGLEALQKQGQWKRLRAQVEAELKARPNDPSMLVWQSKAQDAFQEPEKAQATAKRATEAGPGLAEAWAQLAATSGEMAGKAGLASKWGFARTCKASAEKALALDPRNVLALNVLVVFHDQAPGLVGGDKAKGEACRKALAGLDPDFPFADEINQAVRAKDTARQEAAVRKAIQGRPQETWPLALAANRYLDPAAPRPREAQDAARKILALHDGDAQGYAFLAQGLAAEDKWREVDEVLAQVERSSSDNLLAYYSLGRFLLLTHRDPKRAEACFRRYLGQDPEAGTPDRAAAHWRLALALERQGRKPEAVEQLRTALAIRPDFKDAKADYKRLS